MTTASLVGFDLKMQRAEQHLKTLRGAVERFAKSDFYETRAEIDYKGRLVARLKNVKDPPPDLSILVGECVYNMRSALDQLAYALAAAHTVPLPERWGELSAFPIFKTGPWYRGEGRRRGAASKIQGMSRSAKTSIERLQPYHRRKNPPLECLAMLEELSNVDKHRVLHLTGTAPAGSSFRLEGTGLLSMSGMEVVPGPIRENAVVARFYGEFLPPPAVDVKSNMVPDIVFDKRGDARSVRGLPVVDVLDAIRACIIFCVIPELAKEMARLFSVRVQIEVREPKPDYRRHDLRDFA